MLLHLLRSWLRQSTNDWFNLVANINVLRKLLILIFIVIVAPLRAQEPPLVLATYAYSTNTRLDNLKPLAAYLEQKTGRLVNAVSYPTVQELIAAIKDGRVDLAMINTLGYLSLNRHYGNVALPLVTLETGTSGPTNYGGCLLARATAAIGNIKDAVKDSAITLALVNKSSTSGNLVPRLLFNSIGVPEAELFFNVYYAGTHKQVIDDLLAGKAVVGGCGCNEYEKNLQADPAFGKKVKLLGQYNNIPLGPIVCNRNMPALLRRQIEAALLAVHEENPAVFTAFRAGWTEFLDCSRFRKAVDNDYNQFRRMFGNNETLWQLLDE
jgi:phosphonate transport system substrate-binding protein